MPQQQINSLEELNIDSQLEDLKGNIYRVMNKTPQLVWLSKANELDIGWRCFSIDDFLKINLKFNL